MLERGKHVHEVVACGLLPHLLHQLESTLPAAAARNLGQPLPVRTVEDQDVVPILHPEDIHQVVRLAAIRLDPRTVSQDMPHEKTLHLEFVFAHGGSYAVECVCFKAVQAVFNILLT